MIKLIKLHLLSEQNQLALITFKHSFNELVLAKGSRTVLAKPGSYIATCYQTGTNTNGRPSLPDPTRLVKLLT